MAKNLPAVRKEKSIQTLLARTKKLVGIGNKIIDNPTELIIEDWIKKIWEWANKNNIPTSHIPKKVSDLLKLTELNFFNSDLEDFLRELCFLENIKTLILWDNDIKELPKEIINFSNLIKLNLRGNKSLILNANQKIWLEKLKENGCAVYIDNQDIVVRKNHNLAKIEDITEILKWSDEFDLELPRTLEELKELKEIEFYKPYITYIPKTIDILKNLTSLSLWNNQIEEIPDSISNLTNLTGLRLHSNQIKEIPDSIGNLTNLTSLNLGKNQIEEIPNSIGNLTNLTKLWLCDNQIKEIPDSICNLTNLTSLDLWNNQIEEIPDFIGNLTNLTSLNLKDNGDLILTKKQKEWVNIWRIE